MNAIRTFRIGTRASPLALAQAELVKLQVLAVQPDWKIDIVPMTTTGDRVQDKTLNEIGGKGLFTKELEEALLAGSIDIAVHSMKDMPTVLPAGLIIGLMLEREDVRDAFISPAGKLGELPQGATVGTASLRRAAQIRHVRPDLNIEPLRGNVQTRLRKLAEGQCAATLLAVAGLNRLGMAEHITETLSTELMLPAVAQGAIGIECHENAAHVLEALRPINHTATECAVHAERAMLTVLDGSCRTPIAGYATIHGDTLTLDGLIAKPDGSQVIRRSISGSSKDALKLGAELGAEIKTLAGPDFLTCAS